MILYSMILTTTIIFIFRFLNAERKPQILGVYQQENKGYYLKFAFMFVVLSLRKLFKYVKRRLAIELGKSDDGTMHVHTEEHELEQVQYLGDYPQAVDGVYFNGTSKSGAALVCSVSRRKNRICDAFLIVKVEDGELLLSPKLPDSYLEQKDTEEGEYSVEGIQVKNLVPMRSWTVQYQGAMKSRTNPQKTFQVEVNLTWSTAFQPFNYDNLSPLSLARDMARETWNASYFKMLKRYHETHYEQMGDINGTVTIDGKEHTLDMRCVRDHSFGKHREWGNMHRYVYHFIYLENGDCFAVGSASLPLTMSHLTLGYLCRKSAQRVLPVSACNFQLYQHGEQQILPRDYGFSFEAGSKTYAVQVLVQDEETFFIGKEREAKIYERWCKYQVNGVQGWGCVEWHYNNVQADKRK